MVHEGVEQYVVPFPVTSRLASELFAEKNLQADIIHIDAAHEYEDVQDDIKFWWPLVRPCGILLGDDYEPELWPGVVKATDEFVKLNGLQLRTVGVKWIVNKPRNNNHP